MKIRMTMRTILGLAAVALAFATGGREAAADHVFQLADVMFSDGGTATGAFTTNDALTALITYDITTTTESSFPGFEYTPATALIATNGLPLLFELDSNSSPGHALRLNFTGGLTATGAPLSVGSSSEIFSTGPIGVERHVTSGSVVGVPEPSSLVLGGIAAAAGLGLWAWRHRAARRVG
jgi:hypothetical protein